MFNLTGSEIIFILLIGLVVLGPEKLPGAIRRATKTYAELRKMGDSFQSEFKSVLDEPLREMRETANLIKDQADPKKIAESAERELAAAAEVNAQAAESKLKKVEPPTPTPGDATPDQIDEWSDPVEANVDDTGDDDRGDDGYRVASA